MSACDPRAILLANSPDRKAVSDDRLEAQLAPADR
jgi:hypothetical protein